MTGRNVHLAMCLACALGAAGVSLVAQTPAQRPPAPPRTTVEPAPQPAPAPQPPAPPRREPSGVNIKIDVTITDQRGKEPAVKKTVSIVTGDEMNGRIRTQAQFERPFGDVPLNIDVSPSIRGGKIRLGVSLQYDWPVPAPPADTRRPGDPLLLRTGIQENLSVNLDDGKPLVVAQSADPVSDRQVTIELRATILR